MKKTSIILAVSGVILLFVSLAKGNAIIANIAILLMVLGIFWELINKFK